MISKTVATLCLGTMLTTTVLPFASSSVAKAADSTPVITEIPGTVSTEKAYDETFLSVTGYASVDGDIKDRTQYLNTEAHVKVSTGEEYLAAILAAKEGKVKIIELVADIDLGYNKLSAEAQKTYSSIIKSYKAPSANSSMSSTEMKNLYAGFTNLEMKESGVSQLTINGIDGLTIFSATGNSISHVETKITRGGNDIVIRNIHFKDMWQWDDDGKQKAVGWSNLKLNGGTNLWIDHCTFDVAFDGNIDIENGSSDITISWCKIGQNTTEALDKDGAIYRSITFMEGLYQAGKLTSGVYKGFRDKGATPEQIMQYSAYHKKCHLVGSGDKDAVDYYDSNGINYHDANSNTRLTLAYNYYVNVGQRVPMIRQGTGHLYNCYIDDTTHQDILKLSAFSSSASDYKLSRCLNARNGACIAADTCVFNGIEEPITGAELQGDDLSNMSAPWTTFFKNAYNRSLIVNSKVTNSKGTYTGSSWDNDGSNLLSANFKWNDKSTINNWVWSTTIVGNESMVKSALEKETNPTPFTIQYNKDEVLPYEYVVMPLEQVETYIPSHTGSGLLSMNEQGWTQVSYTVKKDETPEATPEITPEKKEEAPATGDVNAIYAFALLMVLGLTGMISSKKIRCK